MGTNKGPKDGSMDYIDDLADLLTDKIMQMTSDAGEKVSIIGHSLGGIYGRELARRFPEHIDRVITLGTPAHLDVMRSERSVNSLVGKLFKARTGAHTRTLVEGENGELHEMVTPPPGIPLVAIYSPYDGVVTEDTTAIPPECLNMTDGTPRENIEIIASHCGMVVNPLVLLTIADRLLADVKNWQSFDPYKYIPPGMRLMAKGFFPAPISKDMIASPQKT
jgi:triacylglycerol esterase/lipase EstA (alpha/beta hydrolase family)